VDSRCFHYESFCKISTFTHAKNILARSGLADLNKLLQIYFSGNGKQKDTVCQMNSTAAEVAASNRKKCSLSSLPSFSAPQMTHSSSWKKSRRQSLGQLLNFCIEKGEDVPKDHIKTTGENSRYAFIRTQNELLGIGGELLRDDIVTAANKYVNSIFFVSSRDKIYFRNAIAVAWNSLCRFTSGKKNSRDNFGIFRSTEYEINCKSSFSITHIQNFSLK